MKAMESLPLEIYQDGLLIAKFKEYIHADIFLKEVKLKNPDKTFILMREINE